MKRTFCSLGLTLGFFTTIGLGTAQAEPLMSASFQPAPGQLVAQTTLGLQRTRLQLQSVLGANQGVLRFGLVTQQFDYGLGPRTTISVSQTVAHAFQKNPLNTFEGKTGFRGPKLGAAYRLEPAANWVLRPHVELQINPATGSRLNYITAGTQLLWSPSAASPWLLGVEWLATQHKDIRSKSSAYGVLAQWGSAYSHFSFRYNKAKLQGFSTVLGTYGNSPYTRWRLELARRFNPQTWVFVGFEEEQSRGRLVPTFPPLAVDNRRKQHTLSTGLKWQFYP